ncbi:hypothetical protein PCASD_15079 [Puccinia coronata f. sp. avenae]|uniref:Uncharacterized protein n=1 Tax=Puccinia coronata f. sp. avenae TaxID=200324 RepID=A0A2N5UAS7_9BASI|nr:hypothetical protein PCASD_15079 [Puccinia coronata f. sp. avenae]
MSALRAALCSTLPRAPPSREPIGQARPTGWNGLRADRACPITGRTRRVEHCSTSRVRPVNADSVSLHLVQWQKSLRVSEDPSEAMEAGRGWGQGALIRGQTSSSAGVGEHNWSAEDLNVYDWGFLRENLKNKKEAEEAAELQNGFFDFLKECKMKQDRKPYFYIEKDEAAYFMRKFTEKRLMDTTFAIKSDRAHQYRNARYNEILVRISDSRIGLGTRSLFFVDEIMGPMKQHVGDNYRLVYGKLPSKTPAKVTSAEKYVEEITKVTHLMMVIKMLFGNAKPTSF